MKCEQCGAETDPASYELHDYCAECGRNLCLECMEKGCCDNIPALSGMAADEGNDE